MSDQEFSSLGFAPGVVRGARSFSVDSEGRLSGVVFKEAYWSPGVNHAECLKGTRYDPFMARSIYLLNGVAVVKPSYNPYMLPAPEGPHAFDTCKCGFYGYYDGSNDYTRYVEAVVSGVVEGWGETLIGTRGFRCSKARIVALTIHPNASPIVAKQVRDHYWDAPLFPTFDAMVAEFPPDKGEA